MSGSSGAGFIRIRRRDLERLTTEVMQMRDFLPRILSAELVENMQRLEQAESALEQKEQELEQLRMESEHFRSRLEVALSDCVREKEEKLGAVSQQSALEQQLVQQAEYCTHMGSALCNLLWGASNKEEVVRSMLGGDKAAPFCVLAAQTLQSFAGSLGTEKLPQGEESDGEQFVLGLTGIITNVAAVPCGREFLVTSCTDLLDMLMQLLGEFRAGTCTRLRVLMLMSLYNISINMKALTYISDKSGFLSQLSCLLNDPDPEVCLHTLRLFQSVVLEPSVLQRLGGEIRGLLPLQRIAELACSRHPELKSIACELLEDMRALEAEG
ncbi:heat shock factor 2-binding protein [Ascaphus truei]|uniref:heat shock factor 2-binding protein n=1 Tax=Ascaphus truei TaxID=8439 RepID=UPI003F5ABA7F